MDDEIEHLLVEVRASTTGFASDVAQMRSAFDATVLDGFGKAGDILERGLLSAIRKGSLGFDDLKRMALQALQEIAAQAVQLGLDSLFGGGSGTQQGGGDGGILGGLLGGALGSILGLPGRASGGPVSPHRGYLVGERGPELFVPTSAGRVETLAPAAPGGRNVRVAITLAAPRGESAPRSLQRSSRQMAAAVRRALSV